MSIDKNRTLKKKIKDVLPFLNEKQRRIFAAAEASAYGRGGIKIVSEISGMSRQTIYRGLDDIQGDATDPAVRKGGGGRKKITQSNPQQGKRTPKHSFFIKIGSASL